MSYPTWEQVFNKPWPEPTVPCPPAWCADTIAVQLADEECARLIANAMFEEARRVARV